MSEISELSKRYRSVVEDIYKTAENCGRSPDEVTLLPVSKTFPINVLEKGVSECGMRAFGENYVQEACEKFDWFKEHYPELQIEWHLIGPLQSNKTRPIAERFDWVQTIDRLKIAERLSAQRPAGMKPLNVLIEVHISEEESKSGVPVSEVRTLADQVRQLPNLKLRGLMAIPAPSADPQEQMKPFVAMKKLFDAMNEEGYCFDTLSMGMSQDMEQAIKAGATMVRVGSAIFGQRDYSKK